MKKALFISLITLQTSLLFTQNLVQTFPEAQKSSMGTTDWLDYDGDGDQDLLITGYDEASLPNTTLYNNDGEGEFTLVEDSGLPNLSISAIAKGDFNLDGYIDLFVMGETNDGVIITAVYFNDGLGYFIADNLNTFPPTYLGDCNIIDYNNDGHLDIFICGFENTTYTNISKLYVNNGENLFSEVNEAVFSGILNASSEWADYDMDGNIDLFISGMGTDNDYSNLYRNNGDGSFELTEEFTPLWSSDIAWEDYDNDGDLDLIYAGYNTNSGSRQTILYRNDNGSFSSIADNILDASHTAIAWGDYNMDGKKDLFVSGAHEYEDDQILAKLYTNLGEDIFEETNFSFIGVWWADAAWADIDGDTDLDLVYHGEELSGTKHTFVYRNDIINTIDENISQENITIYPNPASNNLTINVFNTSFEQVKIIDILGNMVWEKKDLRTNSIDIQQLKEGVYFLQLNRNGYSNTIQFVKN
jgi:hypothetical protein